MTNDKLQPERTRDARKQGTLAWLSDASAASIGTTRVILDAVRGTIQGSVTATEREWIDCIERQRAALNASTEGVVAFLPYPNASEERKPLGELARVRSLKPEWGRLLFHLVRRLRPATCLELGTAVGISGSYQASALELNGNGRLLTLEGSAGVAMIARRTFELLGLSRVECRVGLFQEILEGALDSLGTVEFAFVDGHHDEHATVEYFRKIAAVAPEGVIVFDDISWSDGMQKAWSVIARDERVRTAIDLDRVGICVVGDASTRKTVLNLPNLRGLLAAETVGANATGMWGRSVANGD